MAEHPIVIPAGAVAKLNAIRASVTELRLAGAVLASTGMATMAADVLGKAKILSSATVTVAVPCMLCRKDTTLAFSADGPANIVIEAMICGPCSSPGSDDAKAPGPVVLMS